MPILSSFKGLFNSHPVLFVSFINQFLEDQICYDLVGFSLIVLCFLLIQIRCVETVLKEELRTVKAKLDDIDTLESAEQRTGDRLDAVRASLRSARVSHTLDIFLKINEVFFGALGSSVGRALDSRSRGLGIKTSAGHLVVGSYSTLSALSEGRCASGEKKNQIQE